MQLAEIVITSGPQSGQSYPIQSNKFLVGRERDCHLRPNDELISRHHCVIRYDGITYRIRDLGSRNGTFVNGTMIQGDIVLVPDDVVKIGNLSFQLALITSSVKNDDDTAVNSLNQTDLMDGTTLTVPEKSKLSEDTKQISVPEQGSSVK